MHIQCTYKCTYTYTYKCTYTYKYNAHTNAHTTTHIRANTQHRDDGPARTTLAPAGAIITHYNYAFGRTSCFNMASRNVCILCGAQFRRCLQHFAVPYVRNALY